MIKIISNFIIWVSHFIFKLALGGKDPLIYFFLIEKHFNTVITIYVL